MNCEKCGHPNQSTIGCAKCGYVYNPDYHPELGAGPLNTAKWLMDQSIESIDKLYGAGEGLRRKSIAAKYISDHPIFVPPPVPPVMPESVVTQEVFPEKVVIPAKPEPVDAEFEDIPEPEKDEKIHATEAEPPVG